MNRSAASGITAAILAGGASSRMGRDKALLRLSAEGPTMIECVVGLLREAGYTRPVIISGDPSRFSSLNLRIIRDEKPGKGPLGGVYTALRHATAPRVLVVACDMPFLVTSLLRFMSEQPRGPDALVPRWMGPAGSEMLEPLLAVYDIGCAGKLERLLDAGRLQVRAALDVLTVRYIEEDELRLYDANLESFRNLNAPEDLANARLLATTRPPDL